MVDGVIEAEPLIPLSPFLWQMLPVGQKYPLVLVGLEPVGLCAEGPPQPDWVGPVQMVVLFDYLEERVRTS